MNKENELGALWARKGEKGEYLTGVVTIDGTAYQVVAFKNDYKTKPNQPDWRVFKSAPKAELVVKDDFEGEYPQEEITVDEIPF